MTTLEEAIRTMPPRMFGEFLKEYWSQEIPIDEAGRTVRLDQTLPGLGENGLNFFEDPIRCARGTLTFYVTPIEVREALWLASLLGDKAYPNILRDPNLAVAYLFSPHSSVRRAAALVVEEAGIRDFNQSCFLRQSLREGLEEEYRRNPYVVDVIRMDGDFISDDHNLVEAWWQVSDKQPPRRKWKVRVSCDSKACHNCLVCMATLSVNHLMKEASEKPTKQKRTQTTTKQEKSPDRFVASLSGRARKALLKHGIYCRAQVEQLTKEQLLAIPGIGIKSYIDISCALRNW